MSRVLKKRCDVVSGRFGGFNIGPNRVVPGSPCGISDASKAVSNEQIDSFERSLEITLGLAPVSIFVVISVVVVALFDRAEKDSLESVPRIDAMLCRTLDPIAGIGECKALA